MSTDKNTLSTDSSVAAHDRIRQVFRKRLAELNLSARAVSKRAGFNIGYLGDFLERRSKAPDMGRILKLAEEMGLSADQLPTDSDAAPLVHLYRTAAANDDLTVPLFAARIAMNSAWVPVEWRPIGTTPTLPNHLASEGVYGVAVFNDLNAPRYFLGETILVSPVSPIKVGDFVFVRASDGRCSIGRLASVDAESATWNLMSSGEEVTAKMTDLADFHRIVGSAA